MPESKDGTPIDSPPRRLPAPRTLRRILTIGGLTLALLPGASCSQADNLPGRIATMGQIGKRPILRDRALEIGVSGSATNAEGATAGTVTLRLGTFRAAHVWLLDLEAEPSFTRTPGLSQLDAEGAATWHHEIGISSTYFFLGMGGGLREQWPGGTKSRRYPMGANAGLLFLVTDRVGVRTEYHFRRVLNPDGDDHNEHKIELGLSVFAHNAAKPWIQ